MCLSAYYAIVYVVLYGNLLTGDTVSSFFGGFFCFVFIFVFFAFLGLHPRHMEVPGLGVKSELRLPAYVTATATQDPSCFCDLYFSSWQCWILNPLSEARPPQRELL